MASLKHQFMSATSECFREGIDKHSCKSQSRERDHKIYSHTDLKTIRDFASNFCKFIKENYPEVKQVKDINQSMCQNFINTKAQTSTQTTLDQYQKRLDKLEKNVNYKFKINVNYQVNIPTSLVGEKRDNRGAGSQFPLQDYDKIMKNASDNNLKSEAIVGLKICRETAFRVSELSEIRVKHLDLENKKIINFDKTKGGKMIREVSISKELAEELKSKIDGKNLNDKIINITPAAINKWVGRQQTILGLEKHSIHDLRRSVATEKFNNLRNAGVPKEEALKQVSNFLNHGDLRGKLLAESYIEKIY